MHPLPAAARPAPSPLPSGDDRLGDLRFRALLGAEEWARLPAEVRRRFSQKAAAGQSIVYVGRVTKMHLTRLGWLLAQLCRLIGGPLPTGCAAGLASVVAITEEAGGGQVWTRLYGRRKGFPQVIHSAKRFAGPTGLEEHVGCGVGMTLSLVAEDGALAFRSDRYFVEWSAWRVYLPSWLTPGRLTARHQPVDAGRFTFALEIDHPRFGRILHQSVLFEEAEP